MSQHRAPIVRATRVLQHVAAGLATFLAVGVVGVVGARVNAPDVPSRVGSSPTLVFPDPPRAEAVAPTTPLAVPPPPVVVEPEPATAPRAVITPPPPQRPTVVVVQDPTPAAPAPEPEPEPAALAPQELAEPPKPAKTAPGRRKWDTRAQLPRQDRETSTATQDRETQLCAVVCVQLGDDHEQEDENR
jgi:outer membrane biosynthesis protein TonB